MTDQLDLHQIVSEPTRCSIRSSSLIDLVFTSDPSAVTCSTLHPLGSSDHKSLSLALSWSVPSPHPVHRTIWRYSDADFGAINETLPKLFHTVSAPDDIDIFWSRWKNLFLSTVQKYIPSKRISVKFSQPWFTKQLKALTQSRDFHYKQAKSGNCPTLWLQFRRARNKVVSAIRSAKIQFLNKLSSLSNNSKLFWQTYLPNRHRIPPLLTFGSITAESTSHKCCLLINSFFGSVFHSKSYSFSIPSSNCPPTLSSLSCSEEDVRLLITSLPSKTSSGPDNISSQMLKGTIDSVSPQLVVLFNQSLSSGCMEDLQHHSNFQGR